MEGPSSMKSIFIYTFWVGHCLAKKLNFNRIESYSTSSGVQVHKIKRCLANSVRAFLEYTELLSLNSHDNLNLTIIHDPHPTFWEDF